jgi:hypothetical protein
MKEDILSVQKMKHKLVTFYLFFLVFVKLPSRRMVSLHVPSTLSIAMLLQIKTTKDYQSHMNSPLLLKAQLYRVSSTTSISDWTLGCSHHLLLLYFIIGIVITIVIVACVGFSTVLAVFSPCLVALGCGACVGTVGGATAGVVGGAVGGTVGGSNRI